MPDPGGRGCSRSWICGVLALAALGATALAQCWLCRTALPSSAEGQALAAGFNSGILFLLAAPFLVVAFLGVLIWTAQSGRAPECEGGAEEMPAGGGTRIESPGTAVGPGWIGAAWRSRPSGSAILPALHYNDPPEVEICFALRSPFSIEGGTS